MLKHQLSKFSLSISKDIWFLSYGNNHESLGELETAVDNASLGLHVHNFSHSPGRHLQCTTNSMGTTEMYQWSWIAMREEATGGRGVGGVGGVGGVQGS